MTDTNSNTPIEVSTEAASTNFFWRHIVKVNDQDAAAGEQVFDLQTTLRGVLGPAQIAAHISMVQAALIMVVDQGGTAKQVGYPQNGGASTKAEKQQHAPDNAPQPSADLPPVDLHEGEAGYFDAESLKVEKVNDKLGYRIMGGMYKKFGVRVWPEVLVAAGKRIDLDPATTYDLKGFVAFFANNENGKPSKVVRLEKKAS